MTTTYIHIYIRTPTRLHYPARLRAPVTRVIFLHPGWQVCILTPSILCVLFRYYFCIYNFLHPVFSFSFTPCCLDRTVTFLLSSQCRARRPSDIIDLWIEAVYFKVVDIPCLFVLAVPHDPNPRLFRQMNNSRLL